MTFKNPLNHWRGAELKAPLQQAQAIQARDVRRYLAAHPDGSTELEIRAACGEIGASLHYLRKRRFAKMTPWNKGDNARKKDLWFSTEPDDPYWRERGLK